MTKYFNNKIWKENLTKKFEKKILTNILKKIFCKNYDRKFGQKKWQKNLTKIFRKNYDGKFGQKKIDKKIWQKIWNFCKICKKMANKYMGPISTTSKIGNLMYLFWKVFGKRFFEKKGVKGLKTLYFSYFKNYSYI